MKKLKKYQQEGRDFLTNNGTLIPYHSILGDDMGLGKTAQAIKAAEKVGAKRLLVICPSSVKVNWMRELMEWSGYSDIFIAGRRGKISAKNCVIPIGS
jgi:SNF2 family DNA or RNA helicase